MTKEELDKVIADLTWEDQNWLFQRIMRRLWPQLKGKRVVLHEAVGFYDDEGITDEDYEYYQKKWQDTDKL